MINIYKKIDKDKSNLFGMIEVTDLRELDKPFLLCLSAHNNYDKSLYGMIREGAQAARLYTTVEDAARYQLSGFPADFIGFRFTSDEHYSENYLELAEQFFFPFLMMNGQSPDDLIKQARKINLLTFCDGALTYKNAEIRLKELLIKQGYPKDIVLSIISQISLVAIGTIIDMDDIKANSVIFIDVNDDEISNGISKAYKKSLTENETNALFIPIDHSNSVLYTYNGSGKHSIKEYLSDDCIAKPAICAIVSHNLENSIFNQQNDSFIPIARENILNILNQYTNNEKTSSLLKQLDQDIHYEGASKYSKGEVLLRRELDMSYKLLVKAKKSLLNEKREVIIRDKKINAMIEGIRKYSSDVAFHQILISAHMWKPNSGEEYFGYESDREIRKEYDHSIQTEENESMEENSFMFELNEIAKDENTTKKDN